MNHATKICAAFSQPTQQSLQTSQQPTQQQTRQQPRQQQTLQQPTEHNLEPQYAEIPGSQV